MGSRLFLFFTLFSLIGCSPKEQPIDVLRHDINEVLAGKDATVGVSFIGTKTNDTISINGDKHLPMQSVFKYHLALAVLQQVDEGKFDLNEKITITKEDLNNNLWSPIRKKYPEGVDLTLKEIIKSTVAQSDNVGCDLLFDLIGNPKIVEEYLHQSGITDVSIQYNEVNQQAVWERQYKNWTTAKAANQALKVFFDNSKKQLSDESYHFLWQTMKASKTGKKCIKGGLPEGIVIAHKTGHSGKNDDGLTAAQNDIGIVFSPTGEHFYLSILVSNSNEESAVNKKIIADIATLCWDYFENKK